MNFKAARNPWGQKRWNQISTSSNSVGDTGYWRDADKIILASDFYPLSVVPKTKPPPALRNGPDLSKSHSFSSISKSAHFPGTQWPYPCLWYTTMSQDLANPITSRDWRENELISDFSLPYGHSRWWSFLLAVLVLRCLLQCYLSFWNVTHLPSLLVGTFWKIPSVLGYT
jgi:hypothetical protein